MIRSYVSRRVRQHLSSDAPYKLTMIILDPATMERCETLQLSWPQEPNEHQPFGTLSGAPSRRRGYTKLKVSRSQNFDNFDVGFTESHVLTQNVLHDSYSKIIHFDNLDFLYQLCFDIHKCHTGSFITVGNLCGPRMKMIRLWNDWFKANDLGYSKDLRASDGKLFTKLVWTDRLRDVGFFLSASEIASPGKIPLGLYSGFSSGPFSDSKFYRIDIEEILIRDHHLLGLFEGLHT